MNATASTRSTFFRGAFVVLLVLILSLGGYVVASILTLSIALLVEAVIVASRFDRMRDGRADLSLLAVIAVVGLVVKPQPTVTRVEADSWDDLVEEVEDAEWPS